MDYLEVPEPSFLELAEEARNVCVEYEQCIYTDEILPQVAGMTRPVLVTVAKYRHSSLNDGATIAPRIFTETIIPVLSAGRCSPVDKMGQAGDERPGDETERSVLSGTKTEDRRTDPFGPVGPYVTFDQVQPVAEGPVGPYITLSLVGLDGKHSPCDTDHGSGSGTEDRGTDPIGPVGPYVTFDQVQPVAEGPVGPYITLSPVGSNGKYSPCDTDNPVADGPVGPSATLGPVGPGGTSSQCKPYQLVADGTVGSTEELALVGTRGKLRIDIKTVVMTDEPANSIGTSPSSDSGIHSLGEQWEDMSLITTDTEEEQYRTSQIHTQMGRRVSDTCIPPNTPKYRRGSGHIVPMDRLFVKPEVR